MTQTSALYISVLATPHPTLSPNGGHNRRTAAKHRKALKEAAYLATVNELNRTPGRRPPGHGIAPARLSYTVEWETGRQTWDRDNLIAALKGAQDGICQALGIDDKGVELGEVEQVQTGCRQGVVFVMVTEA